MLAMLMILVLPVNAALDAAEVVSIVPAAGPVANTTIVLMNCVHAGCFDPRGYCWPVEAMGDYETCDYANAGFWFPVGMAQVAGVAQGWDGFGCTAGEYYHTGIFTGVTNVCPVFHSVASWEYGVPPVGNYSVAANDTFVTTLIQAVDGQTSGAIHGSSIQINDVMRGNWVNTTNEQDGTSSIYTNTSTTINAYAQATGFSDASRTGLLPANIVYELILWPTSIPNPTPNYNLSNLFVIVDDYDTKYPISGVVVQATNQSGSTQSGTTNAAGTVMFQVTNLSLIRLTASKAGYWTGTTTITTTAFGPDTKRIELLKATVTPTITQTPLPGELTVRPTIDARTDLQKDQAMMDQVREFAPTLISFACIFTLLYIAGWKP